MRQTATSSDGFAMAVAVEGGIALVAGVLAWLFGVPVAEQIPEWGRPLFMAIGRGLVVTVPMLIVFWLLMHWDRPTLRALRTQVRWLVREMFPQQSWMQFALVALLAGVGEELLFRGVLQSLLVGWTNTPVGLLIASVLFGAAHALSKLYFALAMLIGLCFGWLVIHYGDLVAPMVAHAMYDFVALVCISRTNESRN